MTGRKRNKGESSKSSTSTLNNASTSDRIDNWLEQLDIEFNNKLIKLENLRKKKIAEIERAYDLYIQKTPHHILYSKIKLHEEETVAEEKTVKQATRCTRQRSSSVTSSGLPMSERPVTRSSSLSSCSKLPRLPLKTVTKYNTPAYRHIPHVPSIITPKVKLNAPLSLARYPQQGEVAVSLQGSPLMVAPLVQNYKANANVTLPNGKVLSILPEQGLKAHEIPKLDEDTRMELCTLKQHIEAFINMGS